MSTPIFSILHATRGRARKAVEAMLDTFASATCIGDIEYIVAANDDDIETMEAFDKFNVMTVFGPYRGSVEAWNAAATQATGRWLIQMQDDLGLPPNWDKLLGDAIVGHYDHGSIELGKPKIIRVSDGYRKDDLICTAIMNIARFRQQGEFLHGGYQSVFSDDEFSVRAYRDAEAGTCTIIDARHIIFRHDNPYHLKQPSDLTHARQNSPEAYALGEKLFWERNPWAAKYRTWS